MDTIKLKFDFPVLIVKDDFIWTVKKIVEVVTCWEFEPIMRLYVPFDGEFSRFIVEKGDELNIDCDNTVIFVKKNRMKGGVKNESD